MTGRILILGAVLGLFVTNTVQGASVEKPQLRLVTEVIKETYCEGPDPELLTLRLLLRLTFKNVGRQKVILERGSKSVPVIRISKTAQDAVAHRFETTINNYIISESSRPSEVSQSPPLNSFVILQPGETYKTISDVSVMVPRSHPVAKMIGSGTHSLQIGVWTWEGSRSEAKLRRTKWHKEGFLWSESVYSEPMPFKVLSNPRPEDCRCETSKVSEEEAISIATQRMSASSRAPASYKTSAIAQGCEWQVVFEPDKEPNKISFIYFIDKNTGKVLDEVQ